MCKLRKYRVTRDESVFMVRCKITYILARDILSHLYDAVKKSVPERIFRLPRVAQRFLGSCHSI